MDVANDVAVDSFACGQRKSRCESQISGIAVSAIAVIANSTRIAVARILRESFSLRASRSARIGVSAKQVFAIAVSANHGLARMISNRALRETSANRSQRNRGLQHRGKRESRSPPARSRIAVSRNRGKRDIAVSAHRSGESRFPRISVSANRGLRTSCQRECGARTRSPRISVSANRGLRALLSAQIAVRAAVSANRGKRNRSLRAYLNNTVSANRGLRKSSGQSRSDRISSLRINGVIVEMPSFG